MTKYLVKIISICAFVVLIPVIIAGVAMSAIGSTMFTVSAYISGAVSETEAASAKAELYIGAKDGDKVKTATASYLNGSEVTVSVDLKGYDFLGWYAGDDKTTDATAEALSSNTSYTFEVKNNTQVTAHISLKQYNLVFQGTYPDGSAFDTATGYPVTNGVYKYGQDLPILSSDKDGTYSGWMIVSGPEGTSIPVTSFTKAEFDDLTSSGAEDEAYVLEPLWNDRVRVTYYTVVDGTRQAIANLSKSYSKDEIKNFAFAEATNEAVSQAVGNGYKFVDWTDEAGTTLDVETIRNVDFETTRNIEVYLKKEMVNYTIKVKKFENSVEPDIATMTYHVGEFGALNLKRTYYELKGIVVGGTEYWVEDNFNGLGSSITTAHPHEEATIEATAIWECNYPQLTIRYSAVVTDVEGSEPVYIEDGGSYKAVTDQRVDGGVEAKQLQFNDKTGLRLEDLVFESMIGEKTFYAFKDEDEDIPTQVVELKSIAIYGDGSGTADVISVDVNTVDFAYIIEHLINASKMSDNFRLEFRFEAVAAE